jgi:hypothetical protein
MHSVSSGFLSTIGGKSPRIIRQFTIGSSDYSSYVIKWPTISRQWNEIKPQNITINLANQEKTFNFLDGAPAQMNTICSVDFGVQYAVGSTETINLFKGKMSRLKFSDANLSLTLIDKIKPFTEVVIGTSDEPIEYVSSNYLISDIAWWLCTSFGGLSAIQSTSNPDIDYAAFLRWASVFSESSVYMNARFDGKKLNEAIRKIGKMTRSTILVEDNILTFARYDTTSDSPISISSDFLYKFNLSIDESEIVNKQIVHAGYSATSRYYQYAVFDINTPSVNSYTLHEELEEDPNVWYINSASAFDLASRIVFTNKTPIRRYSYEGGIANAYLQVGDLVGINEGFHGLSGETVRVMGYKIDMEKASMMFDADASQILSFFYLDDAVYGLLDQAYNSLG